MTSGVHKCKLHVGVHVFFTVAARSCFMHRVVWTWIVCFNELKADITSLSHVLNLHVVVINTHTHVRAEVV